TMRLGYHHSGFRDAKVTAEYDKPQQQIVVRVAEGPRHYCGDVNITGLKQAHKTALVEAITQPPKLRTPWVQGRPAPFDESGSLARGFPPARDFPPAQRYSLARLR